MREYVTVETETAPAGEHTRVSLPACYVQGPGFTWTGSRWASSLEARTLIQAPGSFVVKGRAR